MKFIHLKDQIESIWATWTYIVLKTTWKRKQTEGLARQHINTSSLLNNTDPLNMQQAGWLMWYRHRDSGVTVKATRLRWNSDGKLHRKQHKAALSHCVILCGNSAGGSAHTVYLDTHTQAIRVHTGGCCCSQGTKERAFMRLGRCTFSTWSSALF